MAPNLPSIPIRETCVFRHFPDPVLTPLEQTAFERSLFRIGKGAPVEFGAKQCECSHSLMPICRKLSFVGILVRDEPAKEELQKRLGRSIIM